MSNTIFDQFSLHFRQFRATLVFQLLTKFFFLCKSSDSCKHLRQSSRRSSGNNLQLVVAVRSQPMRSLDHIVLRVPLVSRPVNSPNRWLCRDPIFSHLLHNGRQYKCLSVHYGLMSKKLIPPGTCLDNNLLPPIAQIAVSSQKEPCIFCTNAHWRCKSGPPLYVISIFCCRKKVWLYNQCLSRVT